MNKGTEITLQVVIWTIREITERMVNLIHADDTEGLIMKTTPTSVSLDLNTFIIVPVVIHHYLL